MFVDAYINTATQIFNAYALQAPLSIYLKKYFKSNARFGSRDRKYIAGLLYGIYRLGKSTLPIKDRMLAGSFLSGNLPVLFFQKTAPLLAENYELPFAEKIKLLGEIYQIAFDIPFALSGAITEDEYIAYLFQPSKVFIRLRQHHAENIKTLERNGIAHTVVSQDCISLPPDTRIHEVLPADDDYVIQDYASQLTGHFFDPVKDECWWDCCAASGGKSLLLLDKNSDIKLTVSDIRPAIIEKLHERFRQYHYTKYRAFVWDAAREPAEGQFFDQIIADVPCSGSGTWGRSPEQYYFFDENKLQQFQRLQSAILQNVLLHLKPRGILHYFTCSIFEAENEAVISTVDESKYSIVQKQTLKGFHLGADCLFYCEILRK